MNCETASTTGIEAIRAGEYILITASGDLPSPGWDAQVVTSPLRIFPQQFIIERCSRAGIFPQVITPYTVSGVFRFPPDIDTVVVRDDSGANEISIAQCTPEYALFERACGCGDAEPCPDGADEATGFSNPLSFDAAFADAVDQLPPLPSIPTDVLADVRVLASGAMFGGIAGLHQFYVRVCRVTTP